MQRFCMHSLWFFLQSGVWGRYEVTACEKVAVGVLCMRRELFDWYKTRRAADPGVILTQLSDLTQKMIGTAAEKALKTKAMETYGLLLFVIAMAQKYSVAVGSTVARDLIAAGSALVRLLQIFKGAPINVPSANLEDLSQ